MANTGDQQVNIAVLNGGTVAVSGTANDSATTTFTSCAEAIVTFDCTVVSSSGIFVPVLGGSTDGGTTYVDLVPTTGSAMAAVSATGTQLYRFKNLPPKVRTQWTKTSGTSVTVVAKIIGLVPIDSTKATAV